MPLHPLKRALCAAPLFFAACATTDAPIPLPQGQWELTTSSFINIGRMPGLPRPTLQISDGRLAAYSGCNTGTAMVSAVDGRLAVDKLVSTRRACLEPVGAFEGRYFKLLQGQPYFRIEGETLILAAGDDSARFRRVGGKPPVHNARPQP